MLITENMPLHPRTTTQIILTKLAGHENIYVANDINTRFFRNNQRFRYPLVEIKPAFVGSERRLVKIKLYQINPDVIAFDVPIKFIFCYSKEVEKFQGFLEPNSTLPPKG